MGWKSTLRLAVIVSKKQHKRRRGNNLLRTLSKTISGCLKKTSPKPTHKVVKKGDNHQ
ncbi:MAG: hypothetical protein J6M43_03920 [Neisseriaceae bacterium]|nr:hypothetical protein [Neisseriaceae bacterium]